MLSHRPVAVAAAVDPPAAADTLPDAPPPVADAASVDPPVAADSLPDAPRPVADAAAVDPFSAADAVSQAPPAAADMLADAFPPVVEAAAVGPPVPVELLSADVTASAMALSYFSKNFKSFFWSARDVPEPPISCIRDWNSSRMGVLKRLGLVLGLLVTAGSHLRASPTRSYVAWASVATDERPGAPVFKTVPLPDLPRGGLVGGAIRLTCAGRCLCGLGRLRGGKIRQNEHDGRIITCGRAKSFSKAGIRAIGVSRGGDRSAGGGSCYICRPQGRHQWRLGCTRNGRRRQRWIRSQLAGGLASVDVPRQVGVLSEHVPAHRNRGLDQPAHRARRWC